MIVGHRFLFYLRYFLFGTVKFFVHFCKLGFMTGLLRSRIISNLIYDKNKIYYNIMFKYNRVQEHPVVSLAFRHRSIDLHT